jgi:hypothetical protein
MEIVENARVEIRTRKQMTKVKLAEKDINTIDAMIDILQTLDSLDCRDRIREHLEMNDFVPVIPYDEFVDWLKACKEILSLGIVWDEDTDEVMTMVSGDIIELPY